MRRTPWPTDDSERILNGPISAVRGRACRRRARARSPRPRRRARRRRTSRRTASSRRAGAPRPARSRRSARRGSRPRRWLTWSSTRLQLLGRHRCRVREVEAQLVRPHRRSALAHVVAQHLAAARGAAGASRCGWPSSARAAPRSTRARTGAPRCSVPCSRTATSAWSPSKRSTCSTAAPAAVGLDRAVVARPGRRPRRRTATRAASTSSRPSPSSSTASAVVSTSSCVVADELAGEPGLAGERRRALEIGAAALGRGAGAPALAPPSARRSRPRRPTRPCSAASSAVSSNGKP